MRRGRNASIMAEAAYNILTSDFNKVTGNFFIDDEVIEGSDMKKFKVDPTVEDSDLLPDFFI